MANISKYWLDQGKTESDKKEGKTYLSYDGSLRCDECCNKDRCDEPSHYFRLSCPFCLGTGINATPIKK